MSAKLPVGSARDVRAHAGVLLRRHKKALTWSLTCYALATMAGLAAPRLIGDLVDAVSTGTTTGYIDMVALILAGALILQTLLTRLAQYTSYALGETVFAELREEFLDRVLALPLGTVERAGTGDLLSRTTGDVDALSYTVRFAVPQTLVALVTTVLTLAATFLVGPLVALPCLAGVPLLALSTRWYLRRAPAGYLRERAAYAAMNGSVAETVDGCKTVEALRLGDRRIRRSEADLREAYNVERYTLKLRMVWFPSVELAYVIPVAACVLAGGLMYAQGWATLGQVTAVTLYAQALIDPVDRLISWLDEIAVGATSLARIIGVAGVPPDRVATGASTDDERISASDVRFSYSRGRDVLHGVSLALRPGERIAVVGPSGAGKSTMGRLLAGIHPPRTGQVDVGGVPLVDLELDELRGHVALVTQEHHIFVGTVRDNLRLAQTDASDQELRRALAAVDALDWAEALPDGLDTVLGTDGHQLSPPQAQQIALARLVLSDPHTLVLDEATSLLDPRAARHLERSLSAVLHGRTVVAIAHRLHTAHDADRVVVMEDGQVSEIGTHDELVDADGPYAALWESWHAKPAVLR
ncbi:MAG: ABC transporter ATP-binding protein [Actinomycetes bacterium]